MDTLTGATASTGPKSQKPAVLVLSEAASLHLEGRLEDAANVLTRAIKSGEGDAAVYLALGRIQYERKDFASAAAVYLQLSQLDPSGFTGHFNLGVCRVNLREWGPAAEAFRRGVEAEPMHADALFGLGTCLVHAGQPQEALEALERYLGFFPEREQALPGKALDPQFADALLYVGHALLALGRMDEARSYWLRAISEKPELAAISPAGPGTLEAFPPVPLAVPRLAIGGRPALPRSEWIPEEYYCQSGPKEIRQRVELAVRPIEIVMPDLSAQAMADRSEKAPLIQNHPAAPRVARVLPMREKPRQRRRTWPRAVGAAMAASLLMGVGMWLGGIGKVLTPQGNASTPFAVVEDASPPTGATGPLQPASGPVAWVKQALAKRAAVELTDTFEGDMRAWGGKPTGGGPGWSRQPGGFVRPGHLALFHPSLDFTDYHMEFLGQVESKGMSWVVRAHDARNYVAMKFKVIAPGPQPMLSMVHYPVREGRTGVKVETPIAVMVHANAPYHVEVAVKGNRFVVSIEGEEVDSWTDDAPSSGGVGFFSEASERARLYWVRIYKNDDWLGRVCGFIAGARASSESAWLPGEASPAQAPRSPRLVVQAAIWDKRQAEYPWRASARAQALPDKGSRPWES